MFRCNKMMFVTYSMSSKICTQLCVDVPLQWRHDGRKGVSNHQPHDCLLNRLFRCRSKKTSKFRVTGPCVGNSPVTGEFPMTYIIKSHHKIVCVLATETHLLKWDDISLRSVLSCLHSFNHLGWWRLISPKWKMHQRFRYSTTIMPLTTDVCGSFYWRVPITRGYRLYSMSSYNTGPRFLLVLLIIRFYHRPAFSNAFSSDIFYFLQI